MAKVVVAALVALALLAGFAANDAYAQRIGQGIETVARS